MKKNILFTILIIICVLICGCKNNDVTIEERNIIGGWDIDVSNENNNIPSKIKKVFESATKDYTKMKLTPITLLGTQIVSGTNYMYLCKAETDTSFKWVIVTIYNDLEGNSELKNVKYFNLNDYVNINSNNNTVQTLGGWTVNENSTIKLEDNIQKIFDEVTNIDENIIYKPIALLGEQISTGTNYAVLATCYNKQDNTLSIKLLTIYNDLESNSKLISSANVPLAKYTKQ